MGLEHPFTLATMNNLAVTYTNRGRSEEAAETAGGGAGEAAADTWGGASRHAYFDEQPCIDIPGSGPDGGRGDPGEDVLEKRGGYFEELDTGAVYIDGQPCICISRSGPDGGGGGFGRRCWINEGGSLERSIPVTLMSMSNLASTYRAQGRTGRRRLCWRMCWRSTEVGYSGKRSIRGSLTLDGQPWICISRSGPDGGGGGFRNRSAKRWRILGADIADADVDDSRASEIPGVRPDGGRGDSAGGVLRGRNG